VATGGLLVISPLSVVASVLNAGFCRDIRARSRVSPGPIRRSREKPSWPFRSTTARRLRDTPTAMSEESTTPDLVELVRRQFEAGNRRDLDAVTSSFAPDAVLDGRALGDHFEGRAAIRSFIEEWFGTYEELEFGLEEVRDLGKGVVFAVVTQNGRPVASAGHVRQREGWVYLWVGGLIARLTTSDIDEARAAAERLAEERG
jgi:uncharacterized protein (TIGR02246 family)